MTSIPRSGAEALMPEEYQRQIIESVPQMSSVMSQGYRAPNMSRAQRRIPCLAQLPAAYFSNPGPNSVLEGAQWKKLTRMMWEDKYIDAEEINCIVAIPIAVLEDSDYDIWAEAKPKILEAFGLVFDQAVYYGVSAPQVWPDCIVTAATAAGNFVTLGSVVNANGTNDIYDDIMGVGGVISKVEEDGFMVNGHVAAMTMRSRLRGLRDSSNQPIFKPVQKEGVQGASRYELDGEMCVFPRNGSIIPAQSLLISGDWSQLMYSIRKDITWKILTEAVIQDTVTKEILYNLAQQNMVGLRCSMRLGWQVPNPINRLNTDAETRYPFAVLGSAGS
jgi:HK97 family phage major capsid protein